MEGEDVEDIGEEAREEKKESEYSLRERGRLLRRQFRGYKERKAKERLQESKTFKEYLHNLGMQSVSSTLTNYGISGGRAVNHYIFLRSCLKDIYRLIWKRLDEKGEEEVEATLDRILDFYEAEYVKRFDLMSEAVSEIELYLRSVVKNLRSLEEEYLRVKGLYPPKEELKGEG
jgi:hypothetical protein